MKLKDKDGSKEKVELSESNLKALTVTGMALILSPMLIGSINWLSPVLKNDDGSYNVVAFTGAMFFASGFMIIIYVAVKRFQKALKSRQTSNRAE
jgi:hypothetical protein